MCRRRNIPATATLGRNLYYNVAVPKILRQIVQPWSHETITASCGNLLVRVTEKSYIIRQPRATLSAATPSREALH